MKKHITGRIFIPGSRTTIKRSVYEDSGKYYIILYGQYVEVMNEYPGCTEGWRTKEAY